MTDGCLPSHKCDSLDSIYMGFSVNQSSLKGILDYTSFVNLGSMDSSTLRLYFFINF